MIDGRWPRRANGHSLSKGPAETVRREPAPIEPGKAEVLRWGHDGMLIACGTLLKACLPGGRSAWPKKAVIWA